MAIHSRISDIIIQAKDYLVQHMDNPPSLTELSRIAGLNMFKLKNGVSIKGIALQLGYSSVQLFSKAYSKKFGLPPGKSRK